MTGHVLEHGVQVCLALAVHHEQAVQRALGTGTGQAQVEVAAAHAGAEQEQLLAVAAVALLVHLHRLDMGGAGLLLVQAQVLDYCAMAKADLAGKVRQRRRLPAAEEVLDQLQAAVAACLDEDPRAGGGLAGGRVHHVKGLAGIHAIGDADQHAVTGEGLGQQGEAFIRLVTRDAECPGGQRGVAFQGRREALHFYAFRQATGSGGPAAVHQQHGSSGGEALDHACRQSRARLARGAHAEVALAQFLPVEVLPVLVAPVGQAALEQACQVGLAPAPPFVAAAEVGAGCLPGCLDAPGGAFGCRAHAAAASCRTQS